MGDELGPLAGSHGRRAGHVVAFDKLLEELLGFQVEDVAVLLGREHDLEGRQGDPQLLGLGKREVARAVCDDAHCHSVKAFL